MAAKNSEKPYAVIELEVKGKLFATPCVAAWLEDVVVVQEKDKEFLVARRCHWPDNEKNLTRLLFSRSKPKPTDWHIHTDVRIFTYCRSLSKANDIAEKATMNSDVSDGESLSLKRRRKAPEVFQAGVSSDEDDDHEQEPMKKMRLSSNAISSDQSDNENSNSEFEDGALTEPPKSPAIVLPSPSPRISELTSAAVKPTTPGCRTPAPQLQSVSRRDIFASPSAPETAFARSVLAAVATVKEEIATLQKIVYRIYVSTCNPQDTPDNEGQVPHLPITSPEKFEEFSKHCEIEVQRLAMARFLTEFGMSTIRGSVFKMMEKLMSNEMGMLYNLKGTNRQGTEATKMKKRFKDSIPYSVLKLAVKRYIKDVKRMNPSAPLVYSTCTLDGSIGDWLKDSKKRFENQKKKELKEQAKQAQDADVD